jgi:hypothetical protein
MNRLENSWELRSRNASVYEQRFLIAGLVMLVSVTAGALLLLRYGYY